MLGPESNQEETQEKGRFWCVAIRNSPHMPPETWQEFFGLIGKVGRGVRSASSRRPLSSLKALDLSGNGLRLSSDKFFTCQRRIDRREEQVLLIFDLSWVIDHDVIAL